MYNEKNKNVLMIILVCIGIGLRFLIMQAGHNNDFDSYCIVGDIVCNGGNVYAETHRYNYGPVFFHVQGLCWWLAQFFGANAILAFRVFIVSVLTVTDMGIMWWLVKRFSWRHGIIFFLNPISIFITGFHNQFDNMAVLLALLCCFFYNEEKKIGKKDWVFVALLSFCLMTKHILFLLPVWLFFKKGLPLCKRMMYSVLPPFVFLLSFVPYCITNKEAFEGILQHVFLYRSINNSPLLRIVYEILSVPKSCYFIVYILIMLLLTLYIRNKSFEYLITFYLLAMVTFASAISNQYLIIPIVAMCIYSVGICKYAYFIYGIMFLFLNDCGLNLASKVVIFGEPRYDLLRSLLSGGAAYTVLTGILFLIIMKELLQSTRWKSLKINDYL